jgi:hypothetical protein
MALAHSPSVITTNLGLCLDAANPRSWPGSGTAWNDVSGNARNGTLVNGTAYNSSNGGSFVFDGVDDYVNVSNSNLNHGTANFSYSCWVNYTALTSLGTIFENGSWTNCLLIRYENSYFTIYSMGSLWGTFAFAPTLGVWYKLDFVRDGNVINFYVNGVYQTQISFTANIAPSPNNLFIGMSQHAAGQCFNGKINLAMVYTSALTAAQVAQNFNGTRGRYGI